MSEYRIVPFTDNNHLVEKQTKAIIWSFNGEILHVFDPLANTDYISTTLALELLTSVRFQLDTELESLRQRNAALVRQLETWQATEATTADIAEEVGTRMQAEIDNLRGQLAANRIKATDDLIESHNKLAFENRRYAALVSAIEYALENSGNHKIATIHHLLDEHKLNMQPDTASDTAAHTARYVAEYRVNDGTWHVVDTVTDEDMPRQKGSPFGWMQTKAEAQARAAELNSTTD